MHFVAGLDDFPDVRGVLCLFEGVATGAADGYARVTDRPAATLLHLGPGLANGWANLHNARRPACRYSTSSGTTRRTTRPTTPRSKVTSGALAALGWSRTTRRSRRRRVRYRRGARRGLRTAGSGRDPDSPRRRVLERVVDGAGELARRVSSPARRARRAVLRRAVDALRTKRYGDPDRWPGPRYVEQLDLAERIAAATWPRSSSRPSRRSWSAVPGSPVPSDSIYVAEFAIAQLKDYEALVLIGARDPVSFFAYPPRAERDPFARVRTHRPLPHPARTRGAALTLLVDALSAAHA